jgi:hypothetical protein
MYRSGRGVEAQREKQITVGSVRLPSRAMLMRSTYWVTKKKSSPVILRV